jgi:hypothetical protein
MKNGPVCKECSNAFSLSSHSMLFSLLTQKRTNFNRQIPWQQKNDKNPRKVMLHTVASVSFDDYLKYFFLLTTVHSQKVSSDETRM